MLVVLSAPWWLDGIGHWLVVEDSLDRAEVVVVLGGHMPFRAMEAAAIYREGWAPAIWLTWAGYPPEEAALARLGIQVSGEEVYNRRILEQLGVKPRAIQVVRQKVQNTVEEVEVVARELRRVGAGRVILVTSKPHTRRVRAIWHAVVGETPAAVVRYAREDPYNPERWWRRTRDALAVSREIFGLMNVWAGFPVRPESR